MAPFKFGKKKNKDSASPSSSPSSSKNKNQTTDSPEASTVTDHSKNQPYFNSPNGASTVPNQSNTPQQQRSDNQVGIAYDHNNNIYNSSSPQRAAPGSLQQGGGYHAYGYGSPQQQRLPRTNSPQSRNPFQTPPATAVSSPWSRTKLLISPFPRYRHTASAFANDKGEVFVMGGLHNTSVYGDTWIFKSDNDARNFETFQVDIYENSPAPRVGHASAVCGNAYVIFGGDTVTNDAGEIDNNLYLFNMNNHSWTIPHPVGKCPSGRYGHTIGVIAITNFDSKIYLYGGQLDDVVFNDLVVFNLSSFRRPDVQWEWVTPEDHIQPPGLTNHTMDVYDNKLWLFGGSTGKRLSNDLWIFDPLTKKWDKIKTTGTLPPPVEEHASAVYKDLLIIHGGKNVHGEALLDTYFLNLVTKTWHKLPGNMALESPPKYGHTLSVLKNDKLLILGGHIPDYAKFGDDLETSTEDNGVGTILNVLDLKNLNKIIPGLYHYSTPIAGSSQDKFSNQQHLQQHQQQIFSPPATTPRARRPSYTDSPTVSRPPPPSAAPNGADSNSNQFRQQQFQDSSGSQNPPEPIPKNTSSSSLSSRNYQQSPTLARSKSQSRGVSAEDVFQRQAEVQRSLSNNKTPDVRNLDSSSQTRQHYLSQDSQYLSATNIASSEELPLQLPSPIKSNAKAPVAVPVEKDEISQPENIRGNIGESLNQFETPSSSPVKDAQQSSNSQPLVAPSTEYMNDEGKSSDFLDNYVNDSSSNFNLASKEELVSIRASQNGVSAFDALQVSDDELERSLSTHRPSSSPQSANIDKPYSESSMAKDSKKEGVVAGASVVTPGTGVGITGATAIIDGLKKIVGSDTANISRGIPEVSKPLQKDSLPLGEVPGAFNLVSSGSVNSSKYEDEREQFKTIIDSLSKELEQLKLKTNEQAKSASAKVTTLEKENEELKAKAAEIADRSLQQSEPIEDEHEIKRQHIKLNADYEILKEEHEELKNKLAQIEPVFTSNLIDLQKLNEIIKAQETQLEENHKKLKEQEDWKFKFDELKVKYDALEEKLKEHEELQNSSLSGEDADTSDIKKLTTGLDSFLSKFRAQGGDDSFDTSRNLSINGDEESKGRVLSSLRSQIDDLLKENEKVHSDNESLSKEIEALKFQTTEIETLKTKLAELTRIEENYKESLHSVKSTSRALQLSQSELAKQREISKELQQEIDELKIFNAKKISRNTTPIVNDFNSKQSEVHEDDFENEHYNMKVRDLQAELFITKQDNDDLKKEILTLKKKLLVSNTPTNTL